MLQTEISPEIDILLLGDGQLARKTIIAAYKKSLKVGVVGSSINSPAGQVVDQNYFFQGDINNGEDLDLPIKLARTVALDTEHVAAEYLRDHQLRDKFLFPPGMLPLTQNKMWQHRYLADQSLPLPEFVTNIESLEYLEQVAAEFGYKGVLQTGSAAYDGRGNALIDGQPTIQSAWEKLGTRGNLYLEQFVDFEKELALQIARDRRGRYVMFPLVESTHVNGQLYLAESSDKIDRVLHKEVSDLANKVNRAVPGVGLLTVESFLLRSNSPSLRNRLLINEICIGRLHNSGHHTEGSLETSQADQVVRLAQNLPLGNTSFKRGITHSAMLNLLGARSGSMEVLGAEEVTAKTGVTVDLYGKEAKPDRKLGDLRTHGRDRLKLRDQLFQALDLLNQFNDNLFRVYTV